MIEEIFKLLREYPGVGATTIAIVSASVGWILRNFIQLWFENYRSKKELKTFFWKEKINAAKRASEFYLEYLNFLNLLINQFEIFETIKIENQELFDNIQSEVHFYSKKLKEFPHLEHHHINLFFNLSDKRAMEINSETIRINQQILDLSLNKNDDFQTIEKKLLEIKKLVIKLKNNYSELFDIYKNYLDLIRKDIQEFL